MTTLICHNEQRRERVRTHRELNGIDSLEVSKDQRTLTVYFLGKAPVDLSLRKAQQGAVEINILPTGQLRVETGPNFKQRRCASVDDYTALGRAQDPGDELEQGAFAGPILANQAKDLSLPQLEADIVQGQEGVVFHPPLKSPNHVFLKCTDTLLRNAVLHRDILNADGDIPTCRRSRFAGLGGLRFGMQFHLLFG